MFHPFSFIFFLSASRYTSGFSFPLPLLFLESPYKRVYIIEKAEWITRRKNAGLLRSHDLERKQLYNIHFEIMEFFSTG